MRPVAADAPERFYFCSICPECATGIALEKGKRYTIRILADPESWSDGGWTAATVEEALEGWSSLSDIAGTKWWEHVLKSPFVWLAKGSRPVPDSDWFQIFFAVRDAAGQDGKPERLEGKGTGLRGDGERRNSTSSSTIIPTTMRRTTPAGCPCRSL